MKYCKFCGKEVDDGANVCPHCGENLATSSGSGNASGGQTLGGQNKTTMAIVCFFLGGLGIHNFMMGENKKGIFKIVTSLCCGIGGIFALIDFIKILMGTYVVDPNALI